MADHYPPEFRWVQPVSENSVIAFWCERLNPATAADISNYRAYRADDITQAAKVQENLS